MRKDEAMYKVRVPNSKRKSSKFKKIQNTDKLTTDEFHAELDSQFNEEDEEEDHFLQDPENSELVDVFGADTEAEDAQILASSGLSKAFGVEPSSTTSNTKSESES